MNQTQISTVESTMSDALILTQVETAKKYPRDICRCIHEAEDMALLSPEIAESCVYSVPRAGKTIKGPSVRLAEIFVAAWGNTYMAAEIKENDGRSVTARAYCWDVEKNLRAGVEIKRSITTKEGRSYSYDMQTTTENAACSIALRNAIFKVIPRGYIDSILEKCQQKALGDVSTKDDFSKRRETIFLRLKALGVDEKRIFSYYGKSSIEDFDVNDIGELLGVGTSIKEGHIKATDAFKVLDIENLLPTQAEVENDIGKKLSGLNRNV